ncbi:hypothetical protein CLV80_10617 [Yoonia maritima]|uniref:Uncharacterized protein n=2 Tax=Yoonia maritima TaxID=1435347 RepID=A0A2T0VYL1_9RHOB|nr:hypothetical protein CLV80_10617 [Yoonia maritima]
MIQYAMVLPTSVWVMSIVRIRERLIKCLLMALLAAVPFGARADNTHPTRGEFLALAKQGWVFDLHSSRHRRDPDFPPVQFNSSEVAMGEICVIGEPANRLSERVISSFVGLLGDIYGRRLSVTYANRSISSCPTRPRVYVRLYSGRPPSALFNADLRQMDRDFDIRFPPQWREPVYSPAQANGFFGHEGAIAHLLVRQAPHANLTPLQRDFYTSILTEELFQVVSFGADILKFDRDAPFRSKLQEHPVNLRRVSWQSDQFMTGLLSSNPNGLCGFDVFMLHALAGSGLETVNSAELIMFIETNFDVLKDAAEKTVANPAYEMLLDNSCLALPD